MIAQCVFWILAYIGACFVLFVVVDIARDLFDLLLVVPKKRKEAKQAGDKKAAQIVWCRQRDENRVALIQIVEAELMSLDQIRRLVAKCDDLVKKRSELEAGQRTLYERKP